MTSLQSQYLLCPPLACNTAWTHQQPKIATSGYFIWETDRDSKRNSIKCPRSPTNIATDSQRPSPLKRLTRQTSLIWRSTETSASTCKGQQSKGLGPARCNRVRGWDLQNWRRVWLIQRWIKIHAAEKRWPYTCLQTPEWEVRKELRPWGRQFRRRKCDDMGCHILRPKNSTGAHPRQPSRRSIQRWGFDTTHAARNELPYGIFSARQRSAAHSSCYCELSSQPKRNSVPLAV